MKIIFENVIFYLKEHQRSNYM